MRKLILALLLVIFLILPAYAPPGDAKDIWPGFYGTDNAGPDNGYMVFYDQNAAAWQAPRLIDNDLLDAQWTPQRQGIGWDTDGKWNVSFIEATGNDLEIWESPDADWQDDAGAWAMTDNDATENWLEVDVETRRNWVWAMMRIAPAYHLYYIDLSAGVPAWTFSHVNAVVAADNYSIVLDRNLHGGIHHAFIYTNGLGYNYGPIDETTGEGNSPDIASKDYPQIIVDNEERLWIFNTEANDLAKVTVANIHTDGTWAGDTVAVYTATTLVENYHVTWLMMDDTIHVVLVDFVIGIANSTTLRYLRRTPNGWSAAVVLLTVDSAPPATVAVAWPQITVDPYGNIFVYYIYDTDYPDPAAGGDLRGYYLDAGFYDNYTVVGAGGWIAHTNIDQSADNILWVVAPDSIIVSGEI